MLIIAIFFCLLISRWIVDCTVQNLTKTTCGYYICDISYQWCDTVSGDCSSCEVICSSVRNHRMGEEEEMRSFCHEICPIYMTIQTRSTTNPTFPVSELEEPGTRKLDVILFITLTILFAMCIKTIAVGMGYVCGVLMRKKIKNPSKCSCDEVYSV